MTVQIQLLQTSQQTQQNSTDRANSLQVFMRVLASRNGNLATSAEGARSAITQAQEAMLLALGNVSQYQDIVMDSQTLTTRAQLLKEEAEALNFEANQATANNQTIVALVKEAELYTAGLTDRVVALRQQAENLLARARTAYNLTASGKALEGKTFTDAQRMLQIMREFDAQAAGVSAAANRSLLEVQKVKALSDQAIQNAEVLRSSLQPTQAFAQNARTTAEQAKSTAQSQEQTLAPVRSKAMDLETHANSQLNNLPATFSRVGTANTSLVQPAVQVCLNLSPLLLNVQSRTSTAYQRAQLASQRTNTTRTRLSNIQTNLNNIASLNLQQIASLKAEISQRRSELNADELHQMVAVLLQTSKDQRAWLEEAKLKRNQMRAQIEELKKFSEMIRTT
ncbi:uncharacterized protein LOC106156816 [Lingula anatina]|uniref:Uncharacterized protein LOC106156816 n=1 Tax=Lingula anatina TaxID=7574 RepID=A0A1S3HRM1_LINAN|nr:uncharacterized protein LOC106156816 [Lingula anatina]|eukprot:XP_013387699.1 uncharacterized protein LOC106156816 [Lingula anatina]